MDEKFFMDAMKATGLNPVVIDENTVFPHPDDMSEEYELDLLALLAAVRKTLPYLRHDEMLELKGAHDKMLSWLMPGE